jgi:hypothetical protein
MSRMREMILKQKELMAKYHDIEKKNGALQTEDCPVNLTSRTGQARIKDFAWRITEELGEALDAEYAYEFDLAREELMDGLHFLIEMTILMGREKYLDSLSEAFTKGCNYIALGNFADSLGNKREITPRRATPIEIFIKCLALMCNELKNRPWKQTITRVDLDKVYGQLENLWVVYMAICSRHFPTANSIYIGYFGKAAINQTRQEEKY